MIHASTCPPFVSPVEIVIDIGRHFALVANHIFEFPRILEIIFHSLFAIQESISANENPFPSSYKQFIIFEISASSITQIAHGKNGFAENFRWIQIRKVILLNYQNNYVERSSC